MFLERVGKKQDSSKKKKKRNKKKNRVHCKFHSNSNGGDTTEREDGEWK
jgi:hypothetical protein